MATRQPRPGRPRNPDIAPKVREVTLGLLGSGGLVALRVDDIAVEAGVAKTSLYRRWPTLAALALDALADGVEVPDVRPSGNLEHDLIALAEALHACLVTDPTGRQAVRVGPELAAEPSVTEEYRERLVEPFRQAVVDFVTDGRGAHRYPGSCDPAVVADAALGLIAVRAQANADVSVDDIATVLRATLAAGGRSVSPQETIAKAASAAGAALDTARRSLFRRRG